MRHTRHILSYSGGKDSTAMYLLAMELAERHGFEFFPVFADTGNEHEATLDYVRDLPRRAGGPEIRWRKFQSADGQRPCGQTKHNKLVILEILPGGR